ncbi:hypothetical protein N0B31_05230 [Salinirubellus salinus]|uniref:Uncharacterized protein n=1 Tax=Salinirubellus salinus TaxID=1364945 RepID=A0A9E7R507_9EURY|nr:hypothetical protein [Salinirubellus salinus]UWM55687.1 hypothetical protein N0B31_05230 [Salinirubellus salinus]
MSRGLYGIDEVRHLVNDDPFDALFECLRRIWDADDAFEAKQVADREYRTRLLEREISRQYPDLYDDLVDRVGDHPLMELTDGCGIIMDGMSLREGFRLAADLAEERDWTVEYDWAACEGLPTETKFIAQPWFNANGGKQASMKHDHVAYIGEPEVPPLPGTSPEYVWSRFPDKRLHNSQEGQYTLTELVEVYDEAKELVIDIIEESVHDRFLVSSDHGYVNFSGNNPYRLAEEDEAILKEKFSGRYREVEHSGLLRKLERDGIIHRAGGHYLIRGHHSWTKRGATSRIDHGGLTLVETMTPLLTVDTTGD